MKERPILFSAPMVQAILEGRKTMTRRVIKNQCEHIEIGHDDSGVFALRHCKHGTGIIRCPYGQSGDRLWVRETFCRDPYKTTETYLYMTDFPICFMRDDERVRITGYELKWKPSIFMPRKVSRITLEITNVRVERLQDITEEDARNEGVESAFTIPEDHFKLKNTFSNAFAQLWDQINGIGSWPANPYVWVVEFKCVEIKGDVNDDRNTK